MTNIIDFTAKHKEKLAAREIKPEVEQLAHAAREKIEYEWERFARNNTLNKFFSQSIPAGNKLSVNYLQDLNEIGIVEMQVGIVLHLKAPFNEQIGWRASFILKAGVFETPDMPFESYARCFNILYFLNLKRALTTNDMLDQV